jgi:hypothetical protein
MIMPTTGKVKKNLKQNTSPNGDKSYMGGKKIEKFINCPF